MTRPSPFMFELSEADRAEWERRSRAYTGSYATVLRARIVLLAAQWVENKTIAARLNVPVGVVARWRKRFCEQGIEGCGTRSGPDAAGLWPRRATGVGG